MPEDVRLRLYVTDTLGNPNAEEEYIPQMLRPLAESRREANAVKRAEPITVVMGNPPYKEKAMGRGGWIEARTPKTETDRRERRDSPLDRWIAPPEWGVGAHGKHLRNLYVYFWRWATWKVFGDAVSSPQSRPDRRGVVCFITVAGFLNGPGFQAMRADLRRTADEIWVVDGSPEGHQPAVSSRIFQGVQQPVCIVLVARTGRRAAGGMARVRYRALPVGRREEKFAALAEVGLEGPGWVDCVAEERAPFLPAATGGWATYPGLEMLFDYNGSGVMTGRTWVIGPDRWSLEERWRRLIGERDAARKEVLFHPHIRDGDLGDKYVGKLVEQGLAGHSHRLLSVANDTEPNFPPTAYAFRSFDRQRIIPDARLLNQPNPGLWRLHSVQQIYLTAPHDRTPTSGPALTFTSLMPDLHHFAGRGGRVFPLWADAAATTPNIPAHILAALAAALGTPAPGPDLFAYIAAIAAHPAYTARFARDLIQPGLRIPLTTDSALFAEAVNLGRRVIWLHSFGERFADPAEGRPAGAPRLPPDQRPTIPEAGAIPTDADAMPDTLHYDEPAQRLHVGQGHIDRVPPAVWAYEVSGKSVLTQWFSYRRRNRARPMIGDRRPPSPLSDIQPPGWLPEYTAELLNVLNVLGGLVALEPAQADLLERICEGPTLPADMLQPPAAVAPDDEVPRKRAGRPRSQPVAADEG